MSHPSGRFPPGSGDGRQRPLDSHLPFLSRETQVIHHNPSFPGPHVISQSLDSLRTADSATRHGTSFGQPLSQSTHDSLYDQRNIYDASCDRQSTRHNIPHLGHSTAIDVPNTFNGRALDLGRGRLGTIRPPFLAHNNLRGSGYQDVPYGPMLPNDELLRPATSGYPSGPPYSGFVAQSSSEDATYTSTHSPYSRLDSGTRLYHPIVPVFPNNVDAARACTPGPQYQPVKADPEVIAEFRKNYRQRPKRWFKPGRVFKTLWSEPAGKSVSSQFTVMSNIDGEKIFSKIRIFVVIAQYFDYSHALKISSHGKRGAVEREAQNQYGMIYTGKTIPSRPEGEPALQPFAIRVDPDLTEKLQGESRTDYGRIYPVEDNVKAKSIGMINPKSLPQLLEQFQQVAKLFAPLSSSVQVAEPAPSHYGVQPIAFSAEETSGRVRLLLTTWRAQRPNEVAEEKELIDFAMFVQRFSHVNTDDLEAHLALGLDDNEVSGAIEV